MARRSPPAVNQKYEVGCTWRMFGIFNFLHGGYSNTRLVSNERQLNKLAIGNGNSKRNSHVKSTVDEKYPHVDVSSRRRGYGYGCKSMSRCVENNQVACGGNKVTNEELFLKLLQDPNPLLVKQIHDSQSSQVNKPYQSMQTRITRLNKSQNNNTRQCGQTLKPRISTKIAVLKPSTIDVKVKPHSCSRFFSYNVQNTKPSRFPFGRMKRKLKYIMKGRRKEQQRRTSGCQGLKDDKRVKESKIVRRYSLTNSHASIEKRLNSSLDLNKRHTNNTSIGPFEQNILNLYVEGRKSISEMCASEEFKQHTNSLRRTISFPGIESLSCLRRCCEHCSHTEGIDYFNNYQVVLNSKSGLQKQGGNGSYSSMGQKIKYTSGNIVKTYSGKLLLLDADVSPTKSPADDNLHAHYDIPRDGGGYEQSPTKNSDMNNSTRETEYFLESHPEIQIMEDAVKHDKYESDVEQITREDVTNFQLAVHDKFEEKDFAALIRSFLDSINNVTSSKDIIDYTRDILEAFILKWDELVMKCESSCDSLRDSFIFDELKGSISQFSSDRVLLELVMEAFVDVYHNCGFLPSHISTTSSNVQAYIVKKVLLKEITQLINLHFLPLPSPITLEQLVEMDLARRGSWLNIHAYTEHIVMQVAEGVLEKLVLEIVCVMDTLYC